MDLQNVIAVQNSQPDQFNENYGFPRCEIRDASFALMPHPPAKWIVEGLLPEKGLSVFFGDPGSKKTYSLLSLGVCAALGKDWLGFKINKPFSVLFIDEESGERRMTSRLGAVLRGELAGPDTTISYTSLAGFNLDDKQGCNRLYDIILETGAELVIIDAFAEIMSGEENSKKETQPVLTALRNIAEKSGGTIIVIHHSNKNGGFRGTSAIKGSVDLLIKVESKNGSNIIEFSSEKNRDGEPIRWSAKANWVNGGEQFYLTTIENSYITNNLCSSKQYVLKYLRDHGPSSVSTIEDAVDTCTKDAARQAIYTLANPKSSVPLIFRTNGERRGRGNTAEYDLTQQGRTLAESI